MAFIRLLTYDEKLQQHRHKKNGLAFLFS